MNTDTLAHHPAQLPLAADTANACSAPTRMPERLAQLFRPRGASDGAAHPLLPLLRAYRSRPGPLDPPARAVAQPAPTPVAGSVAMAGSTPAALPAIGTLAQRITALPPLPEAMTEVLLALSLARLSANRSIELIERDPALAARTLRLANSAFYGVPGRVASIGDAVRMLGLRTVSGVLAAAAVHNAIRVESCAGFRFQVYWHHAIATAIAARALAPIAGHDADEAFLAGLMHDIGQLALAAFYPSQASAALALAQAQDLPAEQTEEKVLGMAHPQVGALLAAHWHFPAAIVRAIAHHHLPERAGAGCRLSLSGLVQGSDALAHALDLSADPDEAVPVIEPAAWQALGLQQGSALLILEAVERGTHEIGALLHQT